MCAWEELEATEETAVWDRFHARFCFTPSVKESEWPGIREPEESATYHIGHVYDGDADNYVRNTNDLGEKLIRAFQKCVAQDDTMYVLDWQHACYRLRPHVEFSFESEDDWPVPALPNGDYYIFLASDLSFGVFGHPWEQTMCVFGANLVSVVEEDPPEIFSKKIRVAGKAV